MSNIDKHAVQAVADLKAGYTLGHADVEILNELARIALASLEAKPVSVNDDMAYAFHHAISDSSLGSDEVEEIKAGLRAAFANVTAPPAPVVDADDNFYSWFGREWHEHYQQNQYTTAAKQMLGFMAESAWKAGRRAAMLQGADGTLTNEGTMPVNQFKPVADLYGLTSPTGGETSFTFDAVEARDFIDGGWSCQEYVELGRFQEAMLQNGNSPAQSDCCPEQNYIAPAQDGNSPVIPDGWVLVPEEPTHEMLEAGDEQFGTYDVYRRMIAASPQQEVKP
ncbi:hypothetical protein [Enterobacter hormaechei]|uniref:hypothetical protein n=1 Tax=Enterobacter hormaechei TaxID=158836 RepID=UPI001254E72D|nr:hypothetical protein [Enterobacter hormaechei]VAL08411.1 Uncharacterised protein [Enterobacter hormaechei]